MSCELVYYNNCEFAMLECYRCCAHTENPKHKLRYSPTNSQIEHDYKLPVKVKRQVDRAKSNQVKAALKNERDSIKAVARSTLASGRLRHDGDAVHLDSLRVEHKTRFKSKSVSVSAAELNKGKAQQIDVFEIELALTSETYYVLPAQTYLDLLHYVHNHESHSSPSPS